jgi:lysozyme family protein
MITNFDDAFSAICKPEGGFVDNPADPGGATMYGITESVARACGYQGDMRSLPLDSAKAMAKKMYWDRCQCDQFDPRIGYLVFDAAFNGGHPAQWLQSAAGVTTDGAIGAQTIAAVRAIEPWKIMARFNAAHADYYAGLKNYTFINGWVERIAYNLRLGAQ